MYQRIHVVFPDGAEADAQIHDGQRWYIEPDSYVPPRGQGRRPVDLKEREEELAFNLEMFSDDMLPAGGLPLAFQVGDIFALHWPGSHTLETVGQVESVPGRIY